MIITLKQSFSRIRGMWGILMFIIIGMVVLSFVAGESLPNVKNIGYMKINMKYIGKIIFIPENMDATVNSANLSIFRFPQVDYRQKIIDYNITEPGKLEKDSFGNQYVNFYWKKPELSRHYSLDFSITLETKSYSRILRDIPSLPFTDAQISLVSSYLRNGKLTASNKEIAEKAFELTLDSIDALDAIAALTYWIYNNFEYELSYGEKVIPAIEAYKNRKGTCDEFTHVLIAMARSVGIPARYVSGYSYGAYGQNEKWGPHAWAELYIPGTGWVPADPTYGEVGFIDPSHLKLLVSHDGNTTSERNLIKYIDTEIIKSDSYVDIEVLEWKPLGRIMSVEVNGPKEVSLNYPIFIKADFHNFLDSIVYISPELVYSKQAGFKMIYEPKKPFLRFDPHERKSIIWILRSSNMKRECEEKESNGVITRGCSVYIYNFSVNSPEIAWTTVQFNPLKRLGDNIELNIPKDTFLTGEELEFKIDSPKPEIRHYIITDIAQDSVVEFYPSIENTIKLYPMKSGNIYVFTENGDFATHHIRVIEKKTIYSSVSLDIMDNKVIVNIYLKNMDDFDQNIDIKLLLDGRFYSGKRGVKLAANGETIQRFTVYTKKLDVGEHTLITDIINRERMRHYNKFVVEGEARLSVSLELPDRIDVGHGPYRGRIVIKNEGARDAENLDVFISIPPGFRLSRFRYPQTIKAHSVFVQDIVIEPSYELTTQRYIFEIKVKAGDISAKATESIFVRVSLLDKLVFLLKQFVLGLFK